MYTKALTFAFFVFTLFMQCSEQKNNAFYRQKDFNQQWLFAEDSTIDASDAAFDDTGWQKVDLPHDWSVTDYKVQDSVHVGPFKKQPMAENDQGFLRGGTGWYRKSFTLPSLDENKQVILHFDGVMSECIVYVNGQKAGEHVYGFTAFDVNITPFLDNRADKQQLAVKVIRPENNSRWFAGAGIYREVTISVLEAVHVKNHGVYVVSHNIQDNRAELDWSVLITNASDKPENIVVNTQILSPKGQVVAEAMAKDTLKEKNEQKFEGRLTVTVPVKWGLTDPQLYKAVVTVEQNGKEIDKYEQPFGIRSIHFSAAKGFLLNGKPVLMKGGCLHHDNGLLGAMAFKRAEYRKVQLMKNNGFNAIRTAHNPPSKYLLQACDEMGMLVIDESFDMWVKPKRENDYHKYYKDWWETDTRSMVLRDRNHPSVVMWSIGNEIAERALPSGVEIARQANLLIKSLDTTRPTTQAVNGFWDNPGLPWDSSAHAFAQVDVGGYNYQHQQMERDHTLYPERIMYMSESAAEHIHETWPLVEKHPYIIGDFWWTSIDYLGEAGVGKALYRKNKDAELPCTMPWPWYVSNCGDIDIIGNKKALSYLRYVVWGNSKLEMAVHEPIPESMHEIIYFWGRTNEHQSWNWQGHEGEKLQVSVFSAYPKVRLELNGTVLGEKQPSADSLTAFFKVPYAPGKLVAVGLNDQGEEMDRKVLKTACDPYQLELIAERETIAADRGEIAYINIQITDKEGQVLPFDSSLVHITVKGQAELIAAGSGNPRFTGSLQDNKLRLFKGKGMVIVRSNGKPGKVEITADRDGVKNGHTTLSQH